MMVLTISASLCAIFTFISHTLGSNGAALFVVDFQEDRSDFCWGAFDSGSVFYRRDSMLIDFSRSSSPLSAELRPWL